MPAIKMSTGAPSAVARVSVTPTISTTIYASGDALGGSMEFADVVRQPGGGGVIQSVVIVDLDQEQREIDIVFFNQSFTATADNAAFDPSDADLANVIGHVKVSAGDYVNFTDNAIATITNVGLAYQLVSSGTSLFAQMVVRAAPTFTATSDIQVKLVVLQD